MENEIPVTIQPAPNVPVLPPPNLSKIPLFIILGLITIIGSICVGIQIGKSQTPNQPLITEQPTPSEITTAPTSSPISATPTTNPSANWKTYTETREIKFSIKYPSNWIVDTKDGMYGEKGARFDSNKEAIGSVGIIWNSQPVEPNCNYDSERKELVQIKNGTIEMCHFLGSSQEPEGYFYNSSSNGIKYSIVTSNYPGEENRKMVLKLLSTLEI